MICWDPEEEGQARTEDSAEFTFLGKFMLKVYRSGMGTHFHADLGGAAVMRGWAGDKKSAKVEAIRCARRELVFALHHYEMLTTPES